jgi:hypothetical protein
MAGRPCEWHQMVIVLCIGVQHESRLTLQTLFSTVFIASGLVIPVPTRVGLPVSWLLIQLGIPTMA